MGIFPMEAPSSCRMSTGVDPRLIDNQPARHRPPSVKTPEQPGLPIGLIHLITQASLDNSSY